MAVDTNSLAYLIDPFWQGEGVNGKPLVAGYMCVYIAGTDQKYITWQNWDGTRHPFKIPLGSDGRATILVEVQYTYDCYLYDSFGNLVCSRLNVKPAIGGDVTVYGLTEVWHDGTMSGEGTPQSPLSVVSAGKVYNGIDPIVVNNELNRISANHIPLGVQDPLYFVEDSESACIIGFSGTVPVPEGTMNESAFGYEDGQITSYNGSAFSAGNTYEEGSYVSIDNNTISVTGLQPEGDYAYNSALSSKLDASALPQDLVHTDDLTAYQPVGNYQTAGNYYSASNPSGFITGVDLTDYVTTAQLDEKLDKADSANFYPMTGNPSGFLTAHQSLQGYATEQWVENKGYLTAVDIPESATWNATTQTVSANSAQWAGGTANPQIPVTSTSGISIFESGDKVYFNISADYATEDWVTGQGYLTAETDWTNTITAASANAYEQATAAIPTGLATTGDLQTVSGEITAMIPSTAGLATEDWVTAQGYLTAHQDLSDYQTTAGMTGYLTTADSANFYTTANESGFITGVDLTPYQTVEGMTAYQEAGDYYSASNPSGFLTAHQSLEGYLQDSDLGISDNKITAISGVELSAGGDVPEGVMVESGIEYNSQGYINGYSGSAIATIDQERQWFTHDDTLCHVSNSAQYALGVQVPVVANQMGVDRTLLWSGTPNATGYNMTLSENLNNYDRFEVVWKTYARYYVDTLVANSTAQVIALGHIFANNDGNYEKSITTWATTDGLTYNWKATIHGSFTGNQSNNWNADVVPLKIYGIGRKS